MKLPFEWFLLWLHCSTVSSFPSWQSRMPSHTLSIGIQLPKVHLKPLHFGGWIWTAVSSETVNLLKGLNNNSCIIFCTYCFVYFFYYWTDTGEVLWGSEATDSVWFIEDCRWVPASGRMTDYSTHPGCNIFGVLKLLIIFL